MKIKNNGSDLLLGGGIAGFNAEGHPFGFGEVMLKTGETMELPDERYFRHNLDSNPNIELVEEELEIHFELPEAINEG